MPPSRKPLLLLLPLLAVLLFGNCGGVSGVLNRMSPSRRDALRASVIQRQAARQAAHEKLRGRERKAAYRRIEQRANQQADSILRDGNSAERTKFDKRRNKLERQLLQYRNTFPSPQKSSAERLKG